MYPKCFQTATWFKERFNHILESYSYNYINRLYTVYIFITLDNNFPEFPDGSGWKSFHRRGSDSWFHLAFPTMLEYSLLGLGPISSKICFIDIWPCAVGFVCTGHQKLCCGIFISIIKTEFQAHMKRQNSEASITDDGLLVEKVARVRMKSLYMSVWNMKYEMRMKWMHNEQGNRRNEKTIV